MGLLRHVETLLLEANNFATDSMLFSAADFYQRLGVMPALKSLSLARNKLSSFNFEKCPEMLKFPKMQELDIS